MYPRFVSNDFISNSFISSLFSIMSRQDIIENRIEMQLLEMKPFETNLG